MKKNTQEIKKSINSNSEVYTASFIFRIKKDDEEFQRLNYIIDQVANDNPGFLGKESWLNEKENKRSVVYYWKSLKALKEFSNHPDHQEAKQKYNQWYSGYEVVISKVLKLKSDGNL